MDFSFGMGDEKLGLMAAGRVLGEDERSLSGFVVRPPTKLHSVVILFEV